MSELSTALESPEENDKVKLEKIGRAASRLHTLLKQNGQIKKGLEQSASTMPDARERLNFIDKTMHEASEKTLSAVENALPLIDDSRKTCAALAQQLANAEDLAHHPAVIQAISGLGEIANAEETVRLNLLQIIEAQEFRDVAGQMVNKILDAAVEVEKILLELLREYAPDSKDSLIASNTQTSGPAIKNSADGVNGQDEADALLASLGF